MEKILWFVLGFVSCIKLFLIVIFWPDIVKWFNNTIYSKDLRFRLEVQLWEFKYFVKYKVLRR